jgi:hypothetical protein
MRLRVTSTLPAALAVALVAGGLTTQTASTVSARTGPVARPAATTLQLSQQQLDARYSTYRARLDQLYRAGLSATKRAEVVEREFGIVHLGQAPAGQTFSMVPVASQGFNATLATPSFDYDRLLGHYVMSARYDWNSNCSSKACWLLDKSTTGDMGGYDGFALKLYPFAIYRRSQGISTFNNCGTAQYNVSQPTFTSNYGVGFGLQDRVGTGSGSSCKGTTLRYNMHSAVISETFDFQGTNCYTQQIQVETILAHTWSTTSVNNISITLGKTEAGFAVSWQTDGHRWTTMPATAGYGYC